MKRPHQISKLIFEIEVPEVNGAFSYQNDASSFIRNEVTAVLESLLDEFDQPGKIIHIDKLELDLENINFNPGNMPFLREELRKQLREQLSEQIAKGKEVDNDEDQTVNVTIRSESLDTVKILRYYFDHGRLPWWASHIKGFGLNEEVEKLLDSHFEKFIEMIRENLNKSNFRKRLVAQLKPDLLSPILLKVANIPEKKQMLFGELIRQKVAKNELIYFFNRLVKMPDETIEDRLTFLLESSQMSYDSIQTYISKHLDDSDNGSIILQAVVQIENLNPSEKKKLLLQFSDRHPQIKSADQIEELISSAKNIKKTDNTPTAEDLMGSSDSEDEDYAMVENAGLVIVQPYLKPFFTELGFLNDDKFTNESAQHKAAYLLHYLATGNEEQPEEHQLILNKILCGINPDEPITEFQAPSEKEKEECENLLKAILDNWKALKSTSVQGLREMFILREGQLRNENDGWTLYVEREGPDVLLDKLPWGISLLQAPWLERMIYVEW